MKNKMNYKESIRRQNYRDKCEDVLLDREYKRDYKRATFEKFECTDEDIVNLE